MKSTGRQLSGLRSEALCKKRNEIRNGAKLRLGLMGKQYELENFFAWTTGNRVYANLEMLLL